MQLSAQKMPRKEMKRYFRAYFERKENNESGCFLVEGIGAVNLPIKMIPETIRVGDELRVRIEFEKVKKKKIK